MEHWDLRTLDVQPHQPKILHSSRGESRTIALHQGKVVFDGPSSLLTPSLLRDLYGVQADEILAPAPAPAAPHVEPQPAMAGWAARTQTA